MTDKLQAIREKCTDVNPHGGWRERRDLPNGEREWPTRPVRLADVLLAVSEITIYVADGGELFQFVHFSEGDTHVVQPLNVSWDLCNDDLEKQPPEIIEFLHNLLCV